jgi:hypothetical protein
MPDPKVTGGLKASVRAGAIYPIQPSTATFRDGLVMKNTSQKKRDIPPLVDIQNKDPRV